MSSMLSKYHRLFVEAGYPDCDAVFHEDGSWSIRQFYNRPIIPSLTKWNWVLTNIRHCEISVGFIKKYLGILDPRGPVFFENEEKKSQEAIAEAEGAHNRRAEMIEQISEKIVKNDALCERIAKNGPQELELHNIAKHVPRSEL